jgi:hypothetical protein
MYLDTDLVPGHWRERQASSKRTHSQYELALREPRVAGALGRAQCAYVKMSTILSGTLDVLTGRCPLPTDERAGDRCTPSRLKLDRCAPGHAHARTLCSVLRGLVAVKGRVEKVSQLLSIYIRQPDSWEA